MSLKKRLDLATGASTDLFASVGGGNAQLTWSPDGAYLGFDDDTGIGNWDLFYTSPWDASAPIVDVTQSKLVERELDWNPAWVNDIDP